MGRLIHLNGPTGSGKTTLGRRWVEARRGAILVDPDSLLATLPDWRSRFWELIPVARTMVIDVGLVVGDHDACCATRPHALDLRVRDEPEDESLRRLEALLG